MAVWKHFTYTRSSATDSSWTEQQQQQQRDSNKRQQSAGASSNRDAIMWAVDQAHFTECCQVHPADVSLWFSPTELGGV